MSDSEQLDTEKEKDKSSEPEVEWTGKWSDTESNGMEQCGLLEEMAEEDEAMDLHNEETFGTDDPDMDGCDILGASMPDEDEEPQIQDGEPPGSPVPQRAKTPEPQPPSPPRSPSLPVPLSSSTPPPLLPLPDRRPTTLPLSLPLPPPDSVPSFQPRGLDTRPSRGVWIRGGRSQRARGSRGEIFEDPAVLKGIKARPSLKSMDSAIVDCSDSSLWEQFGFSSWVPPPQAFKGKFPAKPILQDDSILGMFERPPYGPRVPSFPHFLPKSHPCMPTSFPGGRRGLPRDPPPTRAFNNNNTWFSQMTPGVPRSSLRQRTPFAPHQQYNQSCPTPQPMTPKMAQPRFGPQSPRPSFYSPSTNSLNRFRFPGSVAQLHPQHKRLLSMRTPKPRSCVHKSWDPYSNLMSDKEKEWIIRLQMIQLQSENPHLDDYYYQEYYKRLEIKLAEEKRGDWTKRDNPKLTTPYVTKTESYLPVVHIEGSLGQVAVSTCHSPRRAIDAIRAHSPDEELKDVRHPRIEVHIEKLFSLLLEVEEAERKKGRVSAEEKIQLVEDMETKVEQIYSQIRHANSPDCSEELLPCLLVSKGKRLLARLLPFLSHDAALYVLTTVTTHLPLLMTKDQDQALPVLYAPLRDVISQLPFSQLIAVLKQFTIIDPDTSENTLMLACQNEFGLSLLYVLLSQGERILSSNLPIQPNIGDFESWTDTVFQVAQQLTQSSLVEPLFLPPNLLTLFCRYLDKRTVHQLKTNLESASGYLAVAL
ncbi:protein PAT1 homolog 2 [Engraulis encrasicolus]|uniref:protein PAT1 homolog 2 n=1 Tax=Engraulis encrasicolus TaxID=184585 RepID=UPI002FD2313F